MKKMTNEQYWMLRDRASKMEVLYGCPLNFPENVSQAPARYRTEPCLFRSAGWCLHDCLFYLH